MSYFVLSQKEEPGCPIGSLDVALYDKFYTNADDVQYGGFPWYTGKLTAEGRVFSEGMVLISNDKLYDFDIRGVRRFFYIVSESFLEICKVLSVDIVDSSEIRVVSTSGDSIASKKYYAVVFRAMDVHKDVDPATTLMVENGVPFRFKKLVLPVEIDLDLFKYGKLISGSSSLICSERFKILAEGFKGINYTPLDTVLWSGIRAI